MWESPIYIFEREREDQSTGKTNKEVFTIDVTGSAPMMDVPGGQLEAVFKKITEGKDPAKTKILDFGAAKLRNTLYLLKKGFQVYAVEFKSVYNRPQGKAFFKKCKKYKNFHKVTFPDDFYKMKDQFDIILAINVLNVMPLFRERLCALALCRKVIKKNGLLLLYHMRAVGANPEKYCEETSLNDGWMTAMNAKHKHFYAEHTKDELFEMAKSTGFSHNKNFKLSGISGNNYSYIFDPDEMVLLSESLSLNEVFKGGEKHDSKKTLKEEKENFLLSFYLKELESVPAGKGKGDAKKFHRLAARILAMVFDDQLSNFKIEQEIDDGLGRIDVVFENRMEEGFFKRLQNQINCPLIFVECKNYQKNLENPEFDQLSGRLKAKRGLFGILVCRGVKDKKKIIKQCKSKLDKDEHIIVLDDLDLNKLVECKIYGEDGEVDDYISEKHNEVLLFNGS
jgi:SAM-dependent methyltransferase